MRKHHVVALAGVAGALTLGLPAVLAPETTPAEATYAAPLRVAIAELVVEPEVRTGYDREEFRHWVDADGDGCDARREVLIAEADDTPIVGPGCTLEGGRWFSAYDRVSVHDDAAVDMDHLVPLAEAWDSGARRWTDSTREAYANDLGDHRSLIGVTASSNRSKADQDPADWLPTYAVCRYLTHWVAVKHRWRLSVDERERAALRDEVDARDCRDVTVTVTVAR